MTKDEGMTKFEARKARAQDLSWNDSPLRTVCEEQLKLKLAISLCFLAMQVATFIRHSSFVIRHS
jgi:hypothetical protein